MCEVVSARPSDAAAALHDDASLIVSKLAEVHVPEESRKYVAVAWQPDTW